MADEPEKAKYVTDELAASVEKMRSQFQDAAKSVQAFAPVLSNVLKQQVAIESLAETLKPREISIPVMIDPAITNERNEQKRHKETLLVQTEIAKSQQNMLEDQRAGAKVNITVLWVTSVGVVISFIALVLSAFAYFLPR